jgi:PAS domain S-box-containing protein
MELRQAAIIRHQARRSALVVAGTYLVFAVAWIVFSDSVVTMLTDSVSQGALFQTMKGLVFVTLSAVLIYALVSEVLNRDGQAQLARVLSERRLSLVLEAVNDGVWEHELATGAVLGAGHWTELTGYKPEDLTAFDAFVDIIHPDDRTQAVADYEEYLNGSTPTFESEYRIRAANGSWLWVRARGRVINRTADGRPALLMGTFTDLTALKSSEERLASMVDSLRRSEAEIERFAHAAAHDLRQPVRQMVSYAQLFARGGTKLSPVEQAEYADFLHEGGNRLNHILDSLLATFEQRTPVGRFQAVDLDQTVRQVLDKLGGEVARTSTQVTLAPLPIVNGDSVQLGLMFEHLIGNALKFRAVDRVPVLRIGAERQGDVWTITVVDNGIGFPSPDSERVFQAFTRLHPPTQFPGSGMGLALCRSIARHHGGTIVAAGRDGQGATFTVTLPATAPADPVPQVRPVGA